jgi:hypothetical protein
MVSHSLATVRGLKILVSAVRFCSRPYPKSATSQAVSATAFLDKNHHVHGGEFPETKSLFVDSIDKAFFFQLDDQSVIYDIVYFDTAGWFARQRERLADLYFHPFPGRERHALAWIKAIPKRTRQPTAVRRHQSAAAK